ncbi:moesin/ezrin/radixin homolog 2 isoform X2 [Anopheles ziemanni]|uniref:Moesin/ezrin/radixin homolog 1 n=2 Tax=Myzorhynchus TaxID=58250 RepID=A0A084VDA8_ANOSI|nr:moesin/ezrin/radixin homolog 2 isoform X2 [Anopheles coustani]XP_058176981.1 moesin/ezrin/radixin homolog 2 isoform X2 [Anopheles ziemanni]KFB35952.1 AGAP010346-PA-like protein [Anopheles sinensis]
MMVPFRRKKSNKQFPVKVCTFDSELEFHLEHRATGRFLFDLICRTIGLRETWYFGLQYEDSKGNLSWLKMDKKVLDQSVNMTNGSCMFIFLAKFFPENVAEELVQEVTQHLFFLQIKQAILSMDVYCPPEASVLLASYAVQAKYGDYDEAVCKPGMLISENLLPQRVIDQYQMTPQMWEERIKTWYADHRGMSRDEAEMEYLKIAQDLDMFGVNYFPITNKKNTEVWLGVTALGLNIYNKENKLLPVTTFQWNEILHISFDDRKFVVKTNDNKNPKPVIFYSQKLRINKLILDLCVGNHDLYMKRRKPDTMEIQQMKAQAKEEKQRRQVERNKLTREKQLREAAEREKAAMEQRLMQLQEDMRAANEALRRSEEAAELLAEKNRLAEEEAMLLSHKAQEVEQEISRMRMTARKTEEEKMYLERKTQEAELLTARMMEESRKRALEADKLKNELIHARVAEKEAKEKLLNFLSRTSNESILITPSSSPESPMHEINSYDLLADGDMEQLSLEIEKERVEYLAKSKQVQNQLKELRSEIEQLKIGENQCPLDDINAEQLRLGETKYSTLKKVKSGSTKARVAFFEEL